MQIVTNKYKREMKEHGNDQFPFLISYERLSKYESGSFLWHWHPEIELTLIDKGEMIYTVNDHVYHLQEGEALFGNVSSLHAGNKYNNKDCEYISITFDPKLIYGYDNSIIYRKYVEPILQNLSLSAVHFDLSEEWHKDIITILNDIITIGQRKEAFFELDILMQLQKLWKILYSHNNSTPSMSAFDKRNYDRIHSILSYIDCNYAMKLTLEDIAEHIHLCKSECCRLFKRYMKVSLFEFILQYRIEKSLNYLINTENSIVEIANLVGFNDSNYYSKVFTKIKGCSPTRYRKKSLS